MARGPFGDATTSKVTFAAVVMSLQRYEQLLDELNTLRRNNSDNT